MLKLNWRKFFFRLTAVISFGGALFYFIVGIVTGDEQYILAVLAVFWGVWAVYGICHLLFLFGKYIYQGLFEKEE